jgi:serine/threonine protein kinase
VHVYCVAQAVKHLHDRCVIHRDIKPENLLYGASGQPMLADFGWAVHAPDKHSRRRTLCGGCAPKCGYFVSWEEKLVWRERGRGTAEAHSSHAHIVRVSCNLPPAGTPEYLPPEMIARQAHDYRVDIWSLGILTYEFLVGVSPFSCEVRPHGSKFGGGFACPASPPQFMWWRAGKQTCTPPRLRSRRRIESYFSPLLCCLCGRCVKIARTTWRPSSPSPRHQCRFQGMFAFTARERSLEMLLHRHVACHAAACCNSYLSPESKDLISCLLEKDPGEVIGCFPANQPTLLQGKLLPR